MSSEKKELENLSQEDKQTLLNAGVDLNANLPTFALVNDKVVQSEAASVSQKGLELLSLHKAREKFPWVKEMEWKLVDPDKDQYTRQAFSEDADGYFMYLPPGAKLQNPVQACFFIKLSGYTQVVHNLIVVDEGAELHVTNGCAVAAYLDNGAHLGITEIYVRKGGYLTYTMIHQWAKDVEVRPRTGVRVESQGTYISNYISLREAKHVQTSPVVELVGQGARTYLSSVIYAPEGSFYDVGGSVVLSGDGSSAEIVSRAVSKGGISVAPSLIEARAQDVRGHITCDGLMLSDQGEIRAVPSLITHVHDAALTHEAAVGRISDEELFYLTTRGLSEEEATSLIVKGFLSLKIPGIPDVVQQSVDQTVAMLGQGAL